MINHTNGCIQNESAEPFLEKMSNGTNCLLSEMNLPQKGNNCVFAYYVSTFARIKRHRHPFRKKTPVLLWKTYNGGGWGHISRPYKIFGKGWSTKSSPGGCSYPLPISFSFSMLDSKEVQYHIDRRLINKMTREVIHRPFSLYLD